MLQFRKDVTALEMMQDGFTNVRDFSFIDRWTGEAGRMIIFGPCRLHDLIIIKILKAGDRFDS